MSSARTAIQWTDATWNPVVGCTKVSQGCKHCYAKVVHDRRHRAHRAGKRMPDQYAVPFERVQLLPRRLGVPLGWRQPRKIFVNSGSDLFHDDVPDWYISEVLRIVGMSPQHVFQILTKRPARMLAFLRNRRWRNLGYSPAMGGDHYAPVIPGRHRLSDSVLPNLWLGVSVEDQSAAEARIPLLLETPAAVRFVSCEPLVGRVNLMSWLSHYPAGLDWVIVGGESGRGARPLDPDWVRMLRGQCQMARVAFFFKQWGGLTAKSGGRLLDGREWSEFPQTACPS